MSPSFIINILPHHTLSNHPPPHHRTRSRRRRPLLPVTTSVALRIGPSSVMRPPPCQTPLKAPVRGSSPSDASSPQQVTTVSCCARHQDSGQTAYWIDGERGEQSSERCPTGGRATHDTDAPGKRVLEICPIANWIWYTSGLRWIWSIMV
jgi:hypothetical protein